ncbi:MAG: CBS domain-containing protein [Lachnospiraceae bacterium]|nr:CBS domain-containing protein [Lachnospiraceae bacterium]
MNVLFFLTPKSEVAHLHDDWTLRQAIEKLERSGYTAVPLIDRKGQYIGTVTEGDILWTLKKRYDMNLKTAETVSVLTVERRMNFHPVSINASMEDLVQMAMNQNYVPVIDDNRIFIGIVTRKDIIRFCYDGYRNNKTTQEGWNHETGRITKSNDSGNESEG